MSNVDVEMSSTDIEVFNHLSGMVEVHKVAVVIYKKSNKMSIPFSELKKLAFKMKVGSPQFHSETTIEDVAYNHGKKPFSDVPSIFKAVKRHLVKYYLEIMTESGTQKFYGEGSAGADNINNWSLKSYAYEIAHKRASARCLKNALGINMSADVELSGDIDSLIEDSMSSSNFYVTEEYEEVEENEKEELDISPPAGEMQLNSMYDLICRKLDVDFKDNKSSLSFKQIKDVIKETDSELYKILLENRNETPSEFWITKRDFKEFMDFITSKQAGEYLMTHGNLSHTVQGKPNKALENKST